MSERIKGTVEKVGTINTDGTLGTGWTFNAHGGVAFDFDGGVVNVCGYTLAELKDVYERENKRSIQSCGPRHVGD